MTTHRHYWRMWDSSCRCGQYQPGTEEHDEAQKRASIEAEERKRIAGLIRDIPPIWPIDWLPNPGDAYLRKSDILRVLEDPS